MFRDMPRATRFGGGREGPWADSHRADLKLGDAVPTEIGRVQAPGQGGSISFLQGAEWPRVAPELWDLLLGRRARVGVSLCLSDSVPPGSALLPLPGARTSCSHMRQSRRCLAWKGKLGRFPCP